MVVPLHKKGGNDNPNKYRPNSLLPSLSKIFERLLYNQLLDYITCFNLFFCYQFAFRPKNLTVDVLVPTIETIRHVVKHSYEPPVDVFLDLKKAFVTVDHSILIESNKKIESY